MLFDPAEEAVVLRLDLCCFLGLRSWGSHQEGHQMAPTGQVRLCDCSADSHKILHFNRHQYTLQQNYKCDTDCCPHIQHGFPARILHSVLNLFALLGVLQTLYILKCTSVLNLIYDFWSFYRLKILSFSVVNCEYSILLSQVLFIDFLIVL